jgi:light-regulated signal transduction histidine kinase (bacteriophytochrome)
MNSDSECILHLFEIDPERTAQLEQTGCAIHVHADSASLFRALETQGGIALLGKIDENGRERLFTLTHPILALLEHSLENAGELDEVTILDQNVSRQALWSAVRAAMRTAKLKSELAKAKSAGELEAQHAEEEFQQFVYSASHDLKEPLRMVSGYLQLLQKRYGESLNQEALEFIGLAVDGASRMSKLLSDLLAYSRVGTRPARVELVNGDDVMLWLRMSRQHLLDEHGVELTSDPLPAVYFDQGEMLQLFEQFVENSIKFRSTEEKPRIHVSAESRDGEWIFSVRDNGIGFDPQHADRIFGIFKRLVGRDVPGTGMGLALAKRIVQKYGGRIWAVSEPGRGSTFFFTVGQASRAAGQ